MANTSVVASFQSRQDYRKKKELEEGRKAGVIPPEVDENGKEINPHMPSFVSEVPWYFKEEGTKDRLKHQRKTRESNASNFTKKSPVAKAFRAHTYRKGACTNCGSMIHDAKSCIERPRKLGAKWTNKHIAPDEIIEAIGNLGYDEKRDRWSGYDSSSYAAVVKKYELQEEARKKYLQAQQIKKLEDNDDDDMKVDEAETADFAKVEKRVRTTGGGSTGTVRNLRIREDTAKYLRNLDPNSAEYIPKCRSMRENPRPDADPNEQFFAGDNALINTGQALELMQMNLHAQEAFDNGQDIHLQAAPSQAEMVYKRFKAIKETLILEKNCSIQEKYGNASSGDVLPMELLHGQTERVVEYDRTGRLIKGEEEVVPSSKYDENLSMNNHTCVWGSWWYQHQWGYKCCKQLMRNSYCTGAAGAEAAAARHN